MITFSFTFRGKFIDFSFYMLSFDSGDMKMREGVKRILTKHIPIKNRIKLKTDDVEIKKKKKWIEMKKQKKK